MKRRATGTRLGKLASEQLEQRQMLAADVLDNLDLEQIQDDTLTQEVAPVDGTGNNEANPDYGAAGVELLRLTTVEYADGLSTPAGEDRPSAREVSNTVADQPELIANSQSLTDFVWLWGQFIDHDITLSLEADPEETLEIDVPLGDENFDPFGTGEVTISLHRSEYTEDEDGVRQQINDITAFIDGSMVYGSDDATAAALREFEGGRLRVTSDAADGDLLPIGEDGFFEAGDIRANENVLLTSMHTLWVREHNRLAGEIAAADPTLSDEAIYQQARSLVVAQIQAITYNQWLPALLGVDAISSYAGYDETVDASIANVFSTAAFRFGHTMLSTELLRINNDGTTADEGNLSLADAFFSPDEVQSHGIDSLLAGAAAQVAQEIDNQLVDDVRNFLFGPPGAGGLDLASLNIERGREHGLADYNQLREDMGLERVTSFDQITSDAELAGKLEALYGSVDNIDPWVGILAEDHVAGGSLGELGRTILVDQFTRLRDGDRFWYENVFTGETLDVLQNTSLSDVIERNTGVAGLQENVFYDDTVLYYAAAEGDGPANVMVITRGGDVEAVDLRTGNVLASVPADEASKVVLVGSSANGDRFTVAPSVASLNLVGGVIIDAGLGGRDQVTLRGGRGQDTVAVDDAFTSFDGTQVQLEGVERLDIQTGPGRDIVQVIDDGDMRVVVDGRDGRQDDGPRRRNDGPRQNEPRPPVNRLAGPAPRGDLTADLDRAMEDLDRRDDRERQDPPRRGVAPPVMGREVGATLADALRGGRRR